MSTFGPGSFRFPTTRWSIVLAAGKQRTPESSEALAALCRLYWRPLYSYIRSQGYGVDEARDSTQEYFALLLEKDYIGDFRPERGRFRRFLLASVKHFLANEHDRAQAQKRGGQVVWVPLDADFEDTEARPIPPAADEKTPEKIFEQRWAEALLEQAGSRIKQESESDGRSRQFGVLGAFLTADEPRVTHRQAALELHMTEGAVKVAVHRLRRRFRERLREVVAETVLNPDDVDDELEYLSTVLRSQGQ